MAKMVRMLKLGKQKNSFMKYLNKFVKIKSGLERIVLFMVLFLLMCHILTWFWLILWNIETDSYLTWIWVKNYQDLNNFDLYIRAFYFTVTTIATVGFGDISPTTSIEMWFAIWVMLTGVWAFSYATSVLSSFLTNFDETTVAIKEKTEALNEIRDTYSIGPGLYEELRQAIHYGTTKEIHKVVDFIDSLPHRLKIELSTKIHREIVMNIPFLKDKSKDFVSFIGPYLIPMRSKENEIIFYEGEPCSKMYFLSKGMIGFILPEFKNAVYLLIEVGDYFGHLEVDSTLQNKDKPKRKFTAMALNTCEMMILSISSLKGKFNNNINLDIRDFYPEIFKEIMDKNDK